MSVLVQTYGATDWSAVESHLHADPAAPGNPNIMVIPISLGNAYLEAYEWGNDIADFERALERLEWAAQRYELWGQRWLTPAVAQYLAVSALRLLGSEEAEPYANRLEALWRSALVILEQEADSRLGADLPYRNSPDIPGDPYDSSGTGDTKAEENAWESVALAAAASFLPDHPHAADWDRKARQLAYDAITRPSDSPDEFGIKTTTVTEDFALGNHGLLPNPYYTAATLFLLCQGAISYRLAGRPVPEEFGHNVRELYAEYLTYVDGELLWTVGAHPEGDATLFPLPFDPEFEEAAVLCKAAQGYLWKPSAAASAIGLGDELWTAIQNSKVVLYHLMGSFLWKNAEPIRSDEETNPRRTIGAR
jgi:hypothetical protein